MLINETISFAPTFVAKTSTPEPQPSARLNGPHQADGYQPSLETFQEQPNSILYRPFKVSSRVILNFLPDAGGVLGSHRIPLTTFLVSLGMLK